MSDLGCAPRLLLLVPLLTLSAAVVSGQQGIAPLTPAMECSACEVTARQIFKQYNKTSALDRWAGTEVEWAAIMDDACDYITSTYLVAQEAFGAHLKVFADPKEKYDIQNVEEPDWFSKKDEDQYRGATIRLSERCYELIGLYEDDIVDHIKNRETEMTLRKFMCIEKRDVCSDNALKAYRKKESRRRKKWKRKTGKEAAQKRLEKELEEAEAREERREERKKAKAEARKRRLKSDIIPPKPKKEETESTQEL